MDIPFASGLLAWYTRRQTKLSPVRPIGELDALKVRRVLLVLTTGIGDAIFSSSVFASVRSALPEAEIALFCRQNWGELFAADPDIDTVIAYPGKFRGFFATLRSLRSFSPELTIVLHGNDPDIIPLCYLAGSRFIVRIPTTGTVYRDLLSNRDNNADAATLPDVHYIENRLRILDTVGLPIISRSPRIFLDEALCRRIAASLETQLEGKPFWVLHVHAADQHKSLPEDLAGKLILAGLSAFPGHDLVLSGGAENRATLMALVPEASAGRTIVVAGEYSLAETAACLALSKAVVAPDTGILHLAAALDRPVIGLFAATQSALVGPRARTQMPIILEKPQTCDPCLQKKCPHRPVKCMAQFTVEEILTALKRRLIQ